MQDIFSKIKFYYRAYQRLEIMNKAAGLAFFTMIAIFPMILLLATVSGYFISPHFIQETLQRFIQETLPYQSDLVTQNMWALIKRKEAFGWYSFIVLTISAQMLFVNFERIVNRLLHTDKRRHFLITRLLFVVWLLGIVFILLTPVIIEMISARLSAFDMRLHTYASFFAKGGFVLFGFLIFWSAMITMPTKRLNFKRLFLGALFFALTLQLGKFGFKWVTLRHFDRYNLVYGSLSTMVLMTLWMLYFYNIFLFFVYWVGRHRDPHYIQKKS
jgi:membrane protein